MSDVLQQQIIVEDDRTGTHVETLKRAILDNLFYIAGRFPANATSLDYYTALAYTVRDRLLRRWLETLENNLDRDARVVCYLSAEFLMGPHLKNNILNLGIGEPLEQALTELGLDLDEISSQEEEPGLGNGGLGRLAACYLDSLATLGIPSVGYGIRYEFGIFDQEIRDGWQVEITDKWLRLGNPWEIRRPQSAVKVGFAGHTEAGTGVDGKYRVRWIPAVEIKGVPYDTPVLGYEGRSAGNLRLWASEAAESFQFDRFNTGDYQGAVAEKVFSENITKVLYPNDEGIQGKQLRLQQQYFFVSCSLQDMIRVHLRQGRSLDTFHQKWTIQMNDTHPSIAVAELMRLLMDEHGMGWEAAWEITRQALAYTNHTLLPEALERWPLPLFSELLPRHMEIINEINARFLQEVRSRFPGDEGLIQRVSLIDERGERYVQMAKLACVGSHHINGVAALHSQLLKTEVLHDFNTLWPEKFVNVTNGVTPRRWVALSNPDLTALISSRIGAKWIGDLERLRDLEQHVDDAEFRSDWMKVQYATKVRLAAYIREKTSALVNPATMFDVLVKRIHEYKRQHLNVLHIAALYFHLKRNPGLAIAPRTFLFGGKAAPGYYMAKLIIKLITSVGETIDNDPEVRDRLKVVFLPDYNVSLGQRVYPAADLSEQISLAGKEASGTGNMKFAMNGAVTIGTLDGANVEIREEVGPENFFLFGMTTQEVMARKAAGYSPSDYYHSNGILREVIDAVSNGVFSRGDNAMFQPLLRSLLDRDEYMLFADFQPYVDCQARVSEAYLDVDRWSRMSILNTARSGKFSSDRSIRDYSRLIWHVDGFKAPSLAES
ncbi:MAG TPA: glycogen/starch/alpha-glucan phosphorylase [Terracidiphilus sp.]